MRKKLEPSKMESGELTNERPVRTVLSRWTKVLLNIQVVQCHEWIGDFVERPVRTVLSRWTKVLLKYPDRAMPTKG